MMQYGYTKLRPCVSFWAIIAVCLLIGYEGLAQYRVNYFLTDKDSTFLNRLQLKNEFNQSAEAFSYISALPLLLHEKGYIAASVDTVQSDTVSARVVLFIGEAYRWGSINTDSIPAAILQDIGWRRQSGRSINFITVENLKADILKSLEKKGYPFASVWVDSIRLENDALYGQVQLDKGPVYHIDSIRNFGNAKLSPGYLQRYLEIMNGSLYNREKLESVSSRLLELPFITETRPWDLTMHSAGSVLNLYLDPKKSSRFNILVGFLPSNSQLVNNKMLITGEADINLKNALGNGETIGLTWQQIQVKSPRLHILYEQPYIFSSPFGVNFNFDLLKKDSSFLNITMQIGTQYAFSYRKKGEVFLRSFSSNLLGLDTNLVKAQKKLPSEADLRSVSIGISYSVNATDYLFNPAKGYEMGFSISAGTKNLRKNNVILQLQGNGFDYESLYDTVKLKTYLFRANFQGAKYFRISPVSTIKLGMNVGWHQTENIQRNELFQIGGYKLLRGFDEESIFATGYGVSTVEYRYFLGLNSYLFAFSDQGFVKNTLNGVKESFIGAGLGMAFETKAGIFNLTYAAGKRSDTPFNLRQSKIHLGYINYF